MERHITYDEQKVGQNLEQELEGEGSGKPDFVLSLPNGSSLAIDSKAPTELWIEAQENKDLQEAEKEVIQKNYIFMLIADLSNLFVWRIQRLLLYSYLDVVIFS